VEEWKKLDPLLRLQKYLRGKGLWNEEIEAKIKAEAEKIVNQAVQDAEAVPPPDPKEMFSFTFAELTPTLKEQMDDYLTFLKEKEK
jgi:TPP-dependent pyruvate/acetoin dehydrogenase alpha subunit